MDHDAPAQGPVATGGRPSAFRSAILVLLYERERDRFELGVRLAEAGFNRRLVSLLAVVLRSMEYDGLVRSGTPAGDDTRPGRRVYGLTRTGGQQLRDAVPALLRRPDALGGLVGRHLVVRQAAGRRIAATQQAQVHRGAMAWS